MSRHDVTGFKPDSSRRILLSMQLCGMAIKGGGLGYRIDMSQAIRIELGYCIDAPDEIPAGAMESIEDFCLPQYWYRDN